MSAANPLTIDFENDSPAAVYKMVKENMTATHLTISLLSAADMGVLCLEGSVLLQQQEDITRWIGIILRRLPCVTHVTLEMWRSVMYEEWIRSASFPVEALGAIFRIRGDTLVSVTTEAQSPIPLAGSHSSIQSAMRDLSQVQNLQELDLTWLIWVVVPEILASELPEGGAQVVGYVVNPTQKPTFDPGLLINAVNNKRTLRKLNLHLQGCGTEEACSILQGLTQNNVLAHLVLDFFSYRRGGLCSDQLNSVVESSLETNFELEDFEFRDFQCKEWPEGFNQQSKKAAFLLTMNKLGRKALVENPQDHMLWLQTLIEQKDDCQITFYLLSSNVEAYFPSEQVGETGTQESPTGSSLLVPALKKRKMEE